MVEGSTRRGGQISRFRLNGSSTSAIEPDSSQACGMELKGVNLVAQSRSRAKDFQFQSFARRVAVLVGCGMILLTTLQASASPNLAIDSAPESGKKTKPDNDRPWHVDFQIRSLHPRLSETKAMLDERLKGPLRVDWAHTFDRPYTPIDRNTDWGFASLILGVGRQENDWLLWTAYGGGGWGEDRNFDRYLTNTLEVNFKYRYFVFGGDAEIYPWKVPKVQPRMTFSDSLYASRPFLLTGLQAGYVSSEGEGSFRMLNFPLYRDAAHIRDWVGSLRLGLGWNFPLSTRFSLNLAGGYAFNFYRPDEYNGWQLIAGLRYRF